MPVTITESIPLERKMSFQIGAVERAESRFVQHDVVVGDGQVGMQLRSFAVFVDQPVPR